MNQLSRRLFAVFALLALPLFGIQTAQASGAAPDASASLKQKVVIQVSDNNPKKWNLALNNAQNVQKEIGKANIDIEIVAYGPGLPMLKFDSPVGGRVQDAVAHGIKVVACENTMRKTHLSKQDMLPNLAYTRSGVVELMNKQTQGYAYIRP